MVGVRRKMVKLPGDRNYHIHISMRATNDKTHFNFIQSSFISYRDKEIYLKINRNVCATASVERERARDRQRKKERQKERVSSVSTRPTGANGMSNEK